MSNDALASIESEIAVEFAKLTEAVKADDTDAAVASANEVIILVGDRNKKCKLLLYHSLKELSRYFSSRQRFLYKINSGFCPFSS